MRYPAITVALSVFNGGPMLELAVRSIVNQTFMDWELLVLDDGSIDAAIDKLPFLDDPRIIVVRDGQSRGLSARLNQAVDLARGKYVARMDHDDISHPERFARQVAFLETHPEIDLLATACVTMDESGQVNGSLSVVEDHDAICRRPWISFSLPHPTWMGRVDWFQRNRYRDPGPYCCEDSELLLRAYRYSHYHALPEKLLAYRVRTHTPWGKLWRTRIAFGRVQIRYFYQKGEWGSLLLSCGASILRISRDMLRKLPFRRLNQKFLNNSKISKDEILKWNSVIVGLRSVEGV